MKLSILTLVLATALAILPPAVLGMEQAGRAPVGEVLGRAVYADELVAQQAAETQRRKLTASEHVAWMERERRERFRALVWSAVFDDYARTRRIEPTPAEIESHIANHRRFIEQDRVSREQQRKALIAELKSPSLPDARRQQAQAQLETLNSLKDFDEKQAQERRSPEREGMWQDAERRVAEVWVKRWKVNQALHREFGGRIIFQQAGWEPIDAYRKLLAQYEARKAFVARDSGLREAVYSYFDHNFVYADEAQARFYFEKPYWERTDAELEAAGFK
jgi:hypothetical protein